MCRCRSDTDATSMTDKEREAKGGERQGVRPSAMIFGEFMRIGCNLGSSHVQVVSILQIATYAGDGLNHIPPASTPEHPLQRAWIDM